MDDLTSFEPPKSTRIAPFFPLKLFCYSAIPVGTQAWFTLRRIADLTLFSCFLHPRLAEEP